MELAPQILGSLIPKGSNASPSGNNIFGGLAKSLSKSLGGSIQKALTSRGTSSVLSAANDPSFFEKEQQVEAQKQQLEVSKKTNVLLEKILESVSSCCMGGKSSSGEGSSGSGGGLMGMLGSVLPFLLAGSGGGIVRGGLKLLGKAGRGIGGLVGKLIPAGVKNAASRGSARLAVTTQKTLPRAAGRAVGRVLNAGKALKTGAAVAGGAALTGTAISSATESVAEKTATKTAEKTATKAAEKTATKAAGKSATKAAGKSVGKTAVKSVGKAVGKSFVKKIPVIGALFGAALAAERAFSGDWLGAAGELGSGLVSIIPGVGTAASVAIDAALLAKDLNDASGEIEENAEEVESEIQNAETPLEEVENNLNSSVEPTTSIPEISSETQQTQEAKTIPSITTSGIVTPSVSPDLTTPIESENITINAENISIPRLEETIDLIRQNLSSGNEKTIEQFATATGSLVAGSNDFSNVTASRGISDIKTGPIPNNDKINSENYTEPKNSILSKLIKYSPVGMIGSLSSGIGSLSSGLISNSPIGSLSSGIGSLSSGLISNSPIGKIQSLLKNGISNVSGIGSLSSGLDSIFLDEKNTAGDRTRLAPDPEHYEAIMKGEIPLPRDWKPKSEIAPMSISENIGITPKENKQISVSPNFTEKSISTENDQKPQIVVINNGNNNKYKPHSSAEQPRMPVSSSARQTPAFSPKEGVDDSGIIDKVIDSLLGYQTYLM